MFMNFDLKEQNEHDSYIREELQNSTRSWEQKASRLANLNGRLMKEVDRLRSENTDLRRIYSNACVMRDHYKAKLDKLEVKP